MHKQDQNVVLLAPEVLPELSHKQVAFLKSNDPSTHVQTHQGITACTGPLEPGGFATDCRVVTELSAGWRPFWEREAPLMNYSHSCQPVLTGLERGWMSLHPCKLGTALGHERLRCFCENLGRNMHAQWQYWSNLKTPCFQADNSFICFCESPI